MKRLFAGAALLALALSGSASGGHARAARTVSSSRLVEGGHIRITATIGKQLQVGDALKITYRVTNVSKVTRKVQLGFSLWYVVRSHDGVTYDTRVLLRGALLPIVPPTKLRPGQTVTSGGRVLRVRWDGPLRVTPGWENDALPTVRVRVDTSGAPTRQHALAKVLAATGHLLDHCAPARPGVVAIGRIDAPKRSAPPLHAACSIGLRRGHGFYRAQVLVVSPPDVRGHVTSPYERLPSLGSGRNATAVGWLFVVTRRGAISVDSSTVNTTKNARHMAPDWQWTTSGFLPGMGGSHCGGSGGGGGGYQGPLVEFVSKCQ